MRFLDDYNIPHNPALSYINSILYPLLFHPTFSKKFLYLSLILDYSIKEVITVSSENNSLALDIIGLIFYFNPLPHQICLEDAYKGVMKKRGEKGTADYGAYLLERRKNSEFEYYYHDMCNTVETKLCDVVTRIFATLEVKEKPSKKDEGHEYIQRVLEIGEAISTNSTPELFEIVLTMFRTFLTNEPHPNSIKEISMLIKQFNRRDPAAIAKIVVPYVYQAVIHKEENAKLWTTPLGIYFKTACPSLYSAAAKYSLNSVSAERLKYYCNLLGNVLTYSGFYNTV